MAQRPPRPPSKLDKEASLPWIHVRPQTHYTRLDSFKRVISQAQRPLSDKTYTHTHTHKGKTSMPTAGFKPSNPARRRTQTHALDSAATVDSWILIQ